MALVKNPNRYSVTIDVGVLAPGEEKNVDTSLPGVALLIADKELIVLDPSVAPPAPASRRYSGALRGIVQGPASFVRDGELQIDVRDGVAGQALGLSSDLSGVVPVSTATPAALQAEATARQAADAAETAARQADVAAVNAAIAGLAIYRGPWTANTAYRAGQLVTNPGGQLVAARTDFTSGSSYAKTNWTDSDVDSFRGPWAANTDYNAGDVVTFNSLLYQANATFTSGASFVASNWTALSAATTPADAKTNVRAITGPTATAADGDYLRMDATAQSQTVDLGPPTLNKRVTVKKVDSSSNTVTLTGTVDGEANPVIRTPFATHELVGDGSMFLRLRQTLRSLPDVDLTSMVDGDVKLLQLTRTAGRITATAVTAPSAGGGNGPQVDKPGVYVPKGAFPTLSVALAAHATTVVEMTYFSDSTGFGSGGNGGPVNKVRSLAIAAGVTDGGRGVGSPNDTASSSGENLAPVQSKTGFGASGNASDFLNSDTPVSSAAGDVITFQGKGTRVRLIFTILQGTTGRFSYSIDGGATVTVDASVATDGATVATAGVIHVAGLAEGTHTVTVTNLGNVAVAAPTTAPVVSGSNSGGTLPAGTYFYKTTAVTSAGETTPSPASGGTGTAGGSGSMTVTPFRAAGATSYNVYRSTTSGGTYGLVGNVADAGPGSYNATTFTDTGATAPGAAPPTTNTAGFTGTTRQCRVVAEWLRGAGLVLHKQAVSGISTPAYFDASRSSSATQPNVPAQVALGLKTGTSGTPNSSDWGQTAAARPAARNVKAAIFALGLNDSNVASETAFQAALASAQQGFALFVKMNRAGGSDPILVVEHFEYYGNAVSSLYGDRLRTALTGMARSYGVPYVDYNVALGPVNAGPYTGAPHLSQAAYDTEGTFLWTELLGKVFAGSLT